jgi:predicted PurR-regulated permease PerM
VNEKICKRSAVGSLEDERVERRSFIRMKSLVPALENDGSRRKTVSADRPSARSKGGLRRATRMAQIVLCLLAGIAFAYFGRSILLPLLLAWMIAMTLKPPVLWLRQRRLPSSLAAALVLGTFLLGVGLAVGWLGRPTVEWIQSAPEHVTQLKNKYRNVLQPVVRFSAAASNMGTLDGADGSTRPPTPVTVKNDTLLSDMFNWTSDLVAGIGAAIFLTFLFLAEKESLMEKMTPLLLGRRSKRPSFAITVEIQHSISRYLSTISLINIGLGVAVGVAFWFLGMPNAAMWGGFAAILNFLPFFGPTIGIILVGMAGLLAFANPAGALLPVGAYLLLHLMESYLVTPYALGQRFRLNRVIIFLAIMFCAWLWGVIGALLAMPLLVSLKVVSERFPPMHSMAKLLSDECK